MGILTNHRGAASDQLQFIYPLKQTIMTKEQKMTYLIEMALEKLETAMERSKATADMVAINDEYKAHAQLGSLKVIIKEAVHYLELAKQQHVTEAKSS